MSKKLALLLVAALAALGAATGAAAGSAPAPLSPGDASALIATGNSSGASATIVVDPATALAAASIPGADTSYESDMTLDQAVGLDPVADTTAAARRTSSSLPLSTKIWCWATAYWDGWGIWPYDQRITDTTYWCAQYGVKITYRTTSVTTGGTLCGSNWHTAQLIAGGVGYPTFTMRSSAGFSCPTDIPWIVLHPTHHEDVTRDSRGGTKLVGSG